MATDKISSDELLKLKGSIEALEAAQNELRKLVLSRGTENEILPLSDDDILSLNAQIIEFEAKRKKLIEYKNAYAKEKYKRLSIFVSPEKQEEIKKAAAAAKESINGYVNGAIDERLKSGK